MKIDSIFFKIVLLAALYYLLGIFSLSASSTSSIVTISAFLPEGVALAFVLRFGLKVILGIFIGQFFLALGAFSFLPAISIAISNSFEAVMAYYIFKWLDFDQKLRSLKDIYTLIVVIIFILQPFSAFFGTLFIYIYGYIQHESIIYTYLSWYFGNVIGQLLVAPTMLYLFNYYRYINPIKALIFSTIFSALFYFFIVVIPIQNIAILFGITITPLVLLLSHKNGLGYALVSIVFITIVAIYSFEKSVGAFSSFNEIDNIININFYILAHILIVLIVGTLIREKNSAVEKYKSLTQQLEDRVAFEVKKNREKDKIMLSQSRLAQMGETIAMIAHQWRQPLNNLSIINQNLYLKYKNGKLCDDDFEKFYEKSSLVIENMTKTIDDFRNFFKPDRQKEDFCANKTIDELLKLIDEEFKTFGIKINREYQDTIRVYGYKNEFSQAILTILENAKDALISQNILDKNIDIKIFEKTIVIQDNAKGIDEEIIDKIFEPYFSTKNKNGTGLGLYIAKTILEKHIKAKLSVKNGKSGAIFTIEF